jgi:branched-chain amino acid transport system permease protein
MSWQFAVQQLLNALSLGTIYALLALGLAIVYSVLGLLNFAYGALVSAVGYTIYLLEAPLGFWAAGILGVIAAAALSVVTERIIYRPLRGAPLYSTIFATFAFAIAIQAAIRAFIQSRPKSLSIPGQLNGVLHVGGVRIALIALISIGVGGIAMLVLSWLLNRTKFGLALRASSEDFATARLMGAPAGQLFLMAFVLSGLLGGIAGFLYVARTGSVSPDMGFNPLFQAFVAVVLGGFGSLSGAIYGGFGLAILETAMQAYLPQGLVSYTFFFALVIVVGVLYFRPGGLSQARNASAT